MKILQAVRKFLSYFFWNLGYCFRLEEKDFGAFLLRSNRTRWPWKKFRPSVWYNEDGRQWEIYFTNERSYAVLNNQLSVELHVGMETGRVTGLTIWEEFLEGESRSEEVSDSVEKERIE